MRVFWWQGGLHAEPESEEEREKLYDLVDNLKWGPRPEHATYFNEGLRSNLNPSDLVTGPE